MLKKKKRILHIMDKVSVDGSKIAGPARQLVYRIPLYDKSKYEVCLVNLRSDDKACDLLRDQEISVKSLSRGKFDLRVLTDLTEVIDEWAPDLLHLHGYAAWIFGRLAGKLKKVPIIIQEHFVDEKVPPYQRVADFFLQGIGDQGLAVSKAVAEFMVNERYVKTIPIEVIGNGIPRDYLARSAAEVTNHLREIYDISGGERVVGIVGRLAEMKGHQYYLEAAKMVLETHPDTIFMIVGDGPLRKTLEDQATVLGISENVVFAGYQEKVIDYISLFDISVIASIFGEGFCSVAIESFVAETPVVITDIDCFREIYENEKNVVMVPARDSHAIAVAIRRYFDDQETASRIISGATQSMASFDIRQIAKQYIDVYERLIISREMDGKGKTA